MSKVKIGINGFGRIGRLVFRASLGRPDVEVVGINDPFIDPEYMKYMLNYDSIHGKFEGDVEVRDGKFVVNGKEIAVFGEKDPSQLNWASCGAEYIAEATGVFTGAEDASKHFVGGAKKVVITAPSKDAPMFVMGVNHEKYTKDMKVVPTPAAPPTASLRSPKVIHDKFGIVEGLMTTVHSTTATRRRWTAPRRTGGAQAASTTSSLLRRARPRSGSVIPELKGKLTGMAFRVPIAGTYRS